ELQGGRVLTRHARVTGAAVNPSALDRLQRWFGLMVIVPAIILPIYQLFFHGGRDTCAAASRSSSIRRSPRACRRRGRRALAGLATQPRSLRPLDACEQLLVLWECEQLLALSQHLGGTGGLDKPQWPIPGRAGAGTGAGVRLSAPQRKLLVTVHVA